jgi:hypothetical protein
MATQMQKMSHWNRAQLVAFHILTILLSFYVITIVIASMQVIYPCTKESMAQYVHSARLSATHLGFHLTLLYAFSFFLLIQWYKQV